MKLSMWILADWLKDYQPETDIRTNLFEIEKVRLFSADMQMDNQTLYIGRLSDFFHNGNDYVLCTHNNDMIILKTNDLEEVMNCLLNALEFYGHWNLDMMKCITSGGMLQDLFDLSSDVIKAPVFLLDAGYRLLAYKKEFLPVMVDQIWASMMTNEGIDVNFLLELNTYHRDRFEKKGVFFMEKGILPNACYNYNFYDHKYWVGAAVMVLKDDMYVSNGQRDLFEELCGYLGKWFNNHIQEQQNTVMESQLQNVLMDAAADTTVLKKQMLLQGWKATDPIVIIKLDAPYQPFNINAYLCRTLNREFPQICAVTNQLSICVLYNLRESSIEQMIMKLHPWLLGSKYYGTMSRTITIEDSFYKHYQYIAFMSEHCGKEIGQIYTGQDYILPYVFSELQHNSVVDVCHPILNQILAYDQKQHTEFYETLRMYLKKERSLIKTAEALKLHRNSLMYRLKRIEDMFHLDLDDDELRLYLLISFELNRY